MLLLGACGGQQNKLATEPAWKTAYSARECLALSETLIERCGGSIERASLIMSRNPAICEPYGPPEKLAGMWELDLEHSTFFEGANDLREVMRAFEKGEFDYTWLNVRDIAQRPDELAAAQGAGARVYQIQLIGRRSLCASGFGHMGAYPREVLLQKLLSQEAVHLP
ncbi:hypothetical protein E0504_44425 [Parafrankia sp. BMG5.11]|nr:hypothetical protein E0504_44425 [Parafrankia sp. BMG5.11]